MLKKFNLISATFALIAIILMCAFVNAQNRPQKPQPEKTSPPTSKPAQQIQPNVNNTISKVAKNIGSVTVVNNLCGKITIKVELSAGWHLMPANNKVTYKVSTYPSQNDIKTSNDPVIAVDWPAETAFHFIVTARSKPDIGITKYYKVNEVVGVAEACPTYGAGPGEVHLRHEQTGKCMFGDPNDGGAVKTWACWNDPNMIYVLESISGNEVRLRHKRTGKCVYGNAVNGGIAKNWVCWDDPNMVFVKEPLSGNNRFRLRHKATGRCIYGGNSDGAPVKSWGPCWDDPAMVWVVETF